VQAGRLGKPRIAACARSGHHPKGRFCLPACAPHSLDRQPACLRRRNTQWRANRSS